MTPRAALIACLLLTLFTAGFAAAQEPSAPKEFYDLKLAAADLRGAVLDDAPRTTVSVDDKTATAAIRYTVVRAKNRFTFTVSSPVDQKTGNATFLGTDGLSNTSQLKVEFNRNFWPKFNLAELGKNLPKVPHPGKAVLDKLNRETLGTCLLLASELAKARDEALASGHWSPALEPLFQKTLDLPSDSEITKYLELSDPPRSPAPPEAGEDWYKKAQNLVGETAEQKGTCQNILDLAGPETKEWVFRRALYLPEQAARAWTLGVNSTLGRKEFEFLDRKRFQSTGEFASTSDLEMPWSFGASAAMIFLTSDIERRPKSALVLSVSREQGFKAANSLTFCKPADGLAPAENCKLLPGDRPGEEDSTAVTLEYRAAFAKVGLALRAFHRTFDSKSKNDRDFGFEVPIYLLTNKDRDFQGGISLGWSDQDDDGSIAVFVGRKLDFPTP